MIRHTRPSTTKRIFLFGTLISIALTTLTSLSTSVRSATTQRPKAAQRVKLVDKNEHGIHNYTISENYKSPLILKHGCAVTVVLMEPDVDAATLWTLESVADYVQPHERTCILIQTSICRLEREMGSAQAAYHYKAQSIVDSARPLLKDMIHNGQVRMTVLDSLFYNTTGCDNFYSPSRVFENIHYWNDKEFVDKVDADLILMVQSDVVLCQNLDVNLWQDVAWVGAPWRAKEGPKPWHLCSGLPQIWEQGHAHQGHAAPDYPSPSELCRDPRIAPQGNGGFSLRRRSWMRQGIEYCPHNEYSGLDEETLNRSSCRAQAIAEDLYFVSILRGLEAPLPSALEAALFSWELHSVRSIIDRYSITNNSWVEEQVNRRWAPDRDGNDAAVRYHQMLAEKPNATNPLVPIGIHKPWNEFIRKKICDTEISRDCKYLKHLIRESKAGDKYWRQAKIDVNDCLEQLGGEPRVATTL